MSRTNGDSLHSSTAAMRRCDVVATRDNITLLPSENDREVRMKRWLVILALALAVASSATIVARSGYRHQAYRPDANRKSQNRSSISTSSKRTTSAGSGSPIYVGRDGAWTTCELTSSAMPNPSRPSSVRDSEDSSSRKFSRVNMLI
jgi:hypothetical protein